MFNRVACANEQSLTVHPNLPVRLPATCCRIYNLQFEQQQSAKVVIRQTSAGEIWVQAIRRVVKHCSFA